MPDSTDRDHPAAYTCLSCHRGGHVEADCPSTPDDVIEAAAQVIVDTYERYDLVPVVLRSEAPNIARALASAGLLATEVRSPGK